MYSDNKVGKFIFNGPYMINEFKLVKILKEILVGVGWGTNNILVRNIDI